MKLKADAKNRLAERIKTWNKAPPQLFNWENILI